MPSHVILDETAAAIKGAVESNAATRKTVSVNTATGEIEES